MSVWPAAYRILSERMSFRCFDPADAPAVRVAIARSRGQLGQFEELPDEDEPIEVMIGRLRLFRSRFDRDEEFRYLATDRESGDVVGTINAEPLRTDGVLVGGWLDAGYGGRGYGEEALRTFATVALELGHARYVELRIRPDNAASRALANRAGFAHEATLRGRLVVRGEAHDEEIWTALREPSRASSRVELVELIDACGRRLFA